MARKVYTGLVFLKDQNMANEEVKRLETKEGYFFTELPRLANEEEIKDSGIPTNHAEGWNLWIYKWRFATKAEWNRNVQKNNQGAAFQLI